MQFGAFGSMISAKHVVTLPLKIFVIIWGLYAEYTHYHYSLERYGMQKNSTTYLHVNIFDDFYFFGTFGTISE